eukprot:TRINITY_DN10624_c0_g1_i1.p1 TRINITY_DN10624_c0_g1~~TRINITY_DN10624_c0_g1_i1.p1  ORF type:complete len:146 (+),score=5.84 TRINITY_DN10624_c0_g1_i1:65-439(+)
MGNEGVPAPSAPPMPSEMSGGYQGTPPPQYNQPQWYPQQPPYEQKPAAGMPVSEGPHIIPGVQPDPSFPVSERERLPRCGNCLTYNGVRGARGGVMFQCFACGTVCQLPMGWTPPPRQGFCTVL